jgi:hypothetical protein
MKAWRARELVRRPPQAAQGAVMSRDPKLNLDRLVAQVVLDLNLLHWFATKGERRQEILDIIARLRERPEDRAALDLIGRFIAL